MDDETRDKLWRVMAELGRARDRFFIHFSGAGRDTDLRDELLVMEAAVRRALDLLGVRGEPNYELRITNYELENSAPAAQEKKGGKRNG